MKNYVTSRILNESKIGVFGLDINDFFVLIGFYGVVQTFFGIILGINSILAMILVSFRVLF